MTIRDAWGCLAFVVMTVASSDTATAQSTFRITQVFSNLDGSIQYVELTETAGSNGQHRFAGLTLTVRYDGDEKTFTFPNDLPSDQTANRSVIVAASPDNRLPVGNGSLRQTPTFPSLPLRFLRAGSATIDFAGFDRATYEGLPTDGINAWYRDGTISRGTLPGFVCPSGVQCAPRVQIAPTPTFAIEYYSAMRDQYFITALAEEIDALDTGRIAGWQRSGESFAVGGSESAFLPAPGQPVCRFHSPSGVGVTHFFSVAAEECDAIPRLFPQFTLETVAAFYAARPHQVTGACPLVFDPAELEEIPLRPLYRLWNQRVDSNHRYTVSTKTRDAMIRSGYVSEGYGPEGVAMCVLWEVPDAVVRADHVKP